VILYTMQNYFPYYQTNFQVRVDNSPPENQYMNPYQALHERNRILNQQQPRQSHIEPGIISRTYQEPPKSVNNMEPPQSNTNYAKEADNYVPYVNKPVSKPVSKPVIPYSKLFSDAPIPNKPSAYKTDQYKYYSSNDIPSPIIPVTTNPIVAMPDTVKQIISKPVFTKPVTDTPVTVGPVIAKPVTTKPVAVEPVIAKPIISKPVAVEPVIAKPIISKPVAIEPVATKPVTVEAVVAEAVIAKPVAVEPVAIKPIAVEPVATKLVTVEPVIAKPVAIEPVAAEPVAMDPIIIKHISNSDNQTGDNSFAAKLNTEYQAIVRMLGMDLNDDNKPKNIEKPVNAVKGGNKICSQKAYYNKMSEENTATNTGDVETWPKLTSANINTSFKVVGDILPAQKVNIIDNCCLAIDNSYVSGYFRYTSGQSREKLMSFLVHLLEEAKILAEDLLTSIRTSYRENPGNNNVVNNKLPELRNFHRNLIAFLHKFDTMKNVYHDDSKTYASLGDIRNNFYTFEDSFYRDLVLGVE
jgi:hypothetical protein